MQETATRTRPKADIECPTCGAPAETGQLICLECGSRIALAYRRPPSWRVPVAIVSLIVLAAVGGIYFGVQALQDDADVEVAAQQEPSEPEREATDGGGGAAKGDEDAGAKDGEQAGADEEASKKKSKKETADKETDSAGTAPETPAAGGGVRSWPEGEDAYTVVILSSEDRGSASAFARSAVEAGTAAGVLRADDFPALSASTGFHLVFVGSYPNQVKADRAAARLGQRFQGAYPQFVDGSKAKR